MGIVSYRNRTRQNEEDERQRKAQKIKTKQNETSMNTDRNLVERIDINALYQYIVHEFDNHKQDNEGRLKGIFGMCRNMLM